MSYDPSEPATARPPFITEDLVFVGFNSRVIALDRLTGEPIWNWTSPEGSGCVAIIIDGDRLVVSVNGYMYCLDPTSGAEIWRNPLKGMGVGVPCLASVRANTYAALHAMLAAGQQQQQQQQSAQAAGS